MDDFMIRAGLVGLLLALCSGPLGCFVLWRRLAYFGDTMAHSALLGIALGLFAQINITLAVTLTSIFIAVSLLFLQKQNKIASDTLLGILSHSALALGIVTLSMLPTLQMDITSFLFGDLLTVTWLDVVLCAVLVLLSYCILFVIWQPLLLLSLHSALAKAEGVSEQKYALIFTLLIALLIAIAMKLVGILLITALLVIPAACARLLAHTPILMAIFAAIIAVIAVFIGVSVSYFYDTPTGPSIVLGNTLLFLLVLLATSAFKLIKKG
jgi:zinc transport system permease protein